MKEYEKCPNCKAPVRWYHTPGVSRAVCSQKCSGWVVITEKSNKANVADASAAD